MADWLITLNVGSSETFLLTFQDETGAAVDITGCNVRFIVRYNGGSVEWSTANGRVPLTDAAGGEAELRVSEADIAGYTFEFADYEWRLEFPNGRDEKIAEHKVWKK